MRKRIDQSCFQYTPALDSNGNIVSGCQYESEVMLEFWIGEVLGEGIGSEFVGGQVC